MRRVLLLTLLGTLTGAARLPAADPILSGLKNPESVLVAPNGKIYVSVIGEFDKDGDGSVVVVEGGKAVPFCTGLNDPKGLAMLGPNLFVADKDRVWRIDPKGKAEPLATPNMFPVPPKFLNDVVADPETGTLYVSDSGDEKSGGAVYRLTFRGTVNTVADARTIPGLTTPNGVLMDGQNHLIVADFATGKLHRVYLASGFAETIAVGLVGADGLAWDYQGRLFVTDWKNGKVFGIPRPGAKPVLISDKFKAAADLCYDPANKRLLVPDMTAGTLVPLPPVIPGFEVDESPLPLETVSLFPSLKWTGWNPETDTGRPNQFRPLVLTHAGDGSNRNFVAEQHGVIHVFPNRPDVTASKVFLDITAKVQYDDRTNEEGLLGMAFPPRYKESGEVYVYYTPKGQPPAGRTNVIARFKVKNDDPDALDPGSEEEILRYTGRPFWNHAGGTIVFGPDGYLYAVHGDGGAANDPFDNGQNPVSLLGKILRLDVSRKEKGKNYAVPRDNPFVNVKEAAPEVYATGLRNVWRMSFDRQTGKLWAADVGQNLFEEINLIENGGNYGWNRREGLHPFGARGTGPRPKFIDPIWEYHHDVGKSITGGHVYRGSKVPELAGHYLYGDYVSNKLWALKYDEKAGRVTVNRPIPDRSKPVFSFGEDEAGEVYMLTATNTGRDCIYGFVKK